jgi:hypothetical protein
VIGDMISPFKAIIGDAYKGTLSSGSWPPSICASACPCAPTELERDQDRGPRARLSRGHAASRAYGRNGRRVRSYGNPPVVPPALET